MNLCSDDHQEICYEGRTCPLCDTLASHDDDVTSLGNRLDEAKDTIKNLEQEIDDLKSEHT